MNRFHLVTLLFVSLSVTAQVDYKQIYDSKKTINEGTVLHDQEKYSEALKKYKSVDPLDPEYPTAQYEIAVSLMGMEKKDSIYALFERLHKQDVMKDLPTLYTLNGNFLSDEKKYAEAEKVFFDGMKITPNATSHLYNLAILYYREEKFQECIDTLKKIIATNPNALSSHYLLGVIALENGRIAEGSMALLGYLILAPEGKFAKNAVLKLNEKFGENYLEKKNVVFSKSGDNFEELETILKNQLPLRKAYKIYSKIDDVVIRQVQAVIEYAQTHKIGNGYFEQTYIPFLKGIADQKQIENFSYYMLQSLKENLGKSLSSQNKKIDQFIAEYIAKDFWKQFATRKMDFYGNEKDVLIYLQNGIPNLIGTVVNNNKEGKFKLLDKYENISGELEFKNNEFNGLQKYYKDGKITEEKTFVNGKLEGKRITYYPMGNISAEENYKNGKLEGKTITYYINGGKSCEYNLVNDELDGKSVCYFYDGTVKKEIYYSNGKADGKFMYYNELGELSSTETHLKGELNGVYTKYYDPKNIEEEANYDNGKIVGSFKKYFPNGKLKEEYIYKDKKITSKIEYYATGVKSSESNYTDRADLESTAYFNSAGEKYYEEVFNSKEIKYIRQYARNNPKPTEINLSKKAFDIKNLENQTLITGAFEKGRRNGNWNYYYDNSRPKMEMNFNKGSQEGLYKLYTYYGLLYSVSNYANDTISGRTDRFDSRGLKSTYNYRNGELNGPYKTYYASGKRNKESFYTDGNLNGIRKTYSENGQLMFIDHFYNDELISSDIYGKNGAIDITNNYVNKSEKVKYPLFSGNVILEYEMKYGELHGKYTKKDKFNKPIIDSEYRNGKLINAYKDYSPLETLFHERTYYNGQIHGINNDYDLVGKLKIVSNYIFGDEYGLTTRYFYNGSKLHEYTQLDDILEGDYTYFNQKNEALLTIHYVNNIPRYYLKKSKTGELNEKVEIVNQSASLVSNYPNGKVAIQFTLDKGVKQGSFIINSELGKTEYKANYLNELLEGERIQYYTNGNIYCKERLEKGDYEGVQEYYKEDGKLWVKSEYKNDELHGKTEIFTNGVLTTTKKYDSDFLVEIIK